MTLDNKDSFALYRFPYSNEFHLIKGNWSLEKSNTSSNFAITSFKDKKPVYLIGEKTIIKESIRITSSDTTSFNPLIINSFGKKVLDNKQNVYKQLRCENAYLGGVKQYNYLFQNSSTKLLKISF